MQEPHIMSPNGTSPASQPQPQPRSQSQSQYEPEPPSGPPAGQLPSQLLEHWELTRGLARRMLRDPSAAEDAAQEAWLQARHSSAVKEGHAMHSGFFGAILRNVVRSGARADRHREARQGEIVRRREVHGEEAAAPDELAAAAEIGRDLCAAVLELPDVYRDVVLQRYFQGLPTREIALRSHVAEGTVRSRLKRALDQLRERFDEKLGGPDGRSLACLAMLPPASLAGVEAEPAALFAESQASGAGYGGLAAFGALVAALVAAVITAMGSGAGPMPSPVAPMGLAGANVPPPALLELYVAPQVERTAAGQGGEAEAAPELPFEVLGRVLNVDRKPMAGARAALRWRGAQGVSTDLVTGADGAFRLRSPLGGDRGAALTVSGGPHHASRTFRFGRAGVGVNRPPRPGERYIGDVVLAPRGQLVGRLVNGEGEALAGVELWLAPSAGGAGQQLVSGAGGEIVFDGLRAGEYTLSGMDFRFEEVALTETRVVTAKTMPLGDVVMSELKTLEDGEAMDFLAFDHNETEVAPERAPVSGPVFRGHVLRKGQPVAGVDVTACRLEARNGNGEFVALDQVPVGEWLDQVDEIMALRSSVIRARTDAQGRYVLRGVVPGRPYRVVAWGEDDHAVLLPAIAVAEDSSAGSVLDAQPSDVSTHLGAMELVPYASLSLTVNGPANIDGFEYQLRRSVLDEHHVVGADRAGTFLFQRVISGPHSQWLDGLDSRLAMGGRAEFYAQPGAKLSLEIDVTEFALSEVRVSAVDQKGPSPGFRARLLRSGRDDGAMRMGERVDWKMAYLWRTMLQAEPGAWSARALLRTKGVNEIEFEVAGRRIRRAFAGHGEGPPVAAAVSLDGGGELEVRLPESVEFLEHGRLEFLGPRTCWSARIQDGELVELPWRVTSPGPSTLRVGALGQVGGEFRIRVTDLGGSGVARAGRGASAEDEEGQILFEVSRQLTITGSRTTDWSLR